MTNLQIAQLAARNAEAAYLFHSVEHDRDAAEYYWNRLCYWQRRVEELTGKPGKLPININ